MNKENVSKWIDALRSGKYKQGVGSFKYLETPDINGPCLHCAVGVACEVMNPEGYYLKEVFQFKDLDALSEWLGLDEDIFCIIEDLNDSWKFTFNEIAEYLEALCGD